MINEEELYRWWNVFIGDGGFTEVRILGKFQYSGYFRTPEAVLSAITPYLDMEDEQFYFVLNEIDEACYGRQQSEKIVKSPKITTNDNDIIRRRWVMVDFDPVRKSGTNASNEEYQLAFNKAKDVYYYLKDQGFPDPVIANSGNGTHLQYRVDLPADEETTDTIKRFFQYLGKQFSDEKVEVDPKNYNLARLCKLYSTTAKKGANLEDRPWRESRIIYVPKAISFVPIERFKVLADLLPKEEDAPRNAIRPQGRHYGSNQPFDLATWLSQHGIVYRTKQSGNSTLYELENCPWIDNHSDRKKWDSALFQDSDGKITFNCTHSHCQGKTWQDVRMLYEPGAYDRRRAYDGYGHAAPAYRPYIQRMPVYEIKDETPDIGKKWLDLGDVADINLDDMPRIHTGFYEIDQTMGGGLFLSETTIVSGINGSGKSSWLNTVLLNAIQDGYKVALWTGELPSVRLKRWLVQAAAGTHVKESLKSPGKYYVEKQVTERITEWLHGRFVLYNNDYSSNYAQLLNDMEEPVKNGFKLFILDNLFSMDLSGIEGDNNAQQKSLILRLVAYAKKEGLHIILVAHPRKVVTFLRKEDILGSSALQNAVDNIFIIHRRGKDFERRASEFFDKRDIAPLMKYGNIVEICKNREFGSLEQLIGLYFNTSNRHFYDGRGEFAYGWESQPVQQSITFAKREDMPFEPPTEEDEEPF